MPPTTQTNISANSLLQKKIQEIEAISDKLPVVIIIHSINPFVVEYMSPNGQQILGFSLEEIKKMGEEYHDAFFNPEDIADYGPKLFNLLNSNSDHRPISYFQQVRPSPAHDWNWYLTTTQIFLRDDTGKPTHIISAASLVEPLHHVTSKVNRLLEENNFLRRNQEVFASLTKREKEILKLMASGKSTPEIAAQLFLSEKTVNTHRRNIKAKLNAHTNYDITKFAQAFDLI